MENYPFEALLGGLRRIRRKLMSQLAQQLRKEIALLAKHANGHSNLYKAASEITAQMADLSAQHRTELLNMMARELTRHDYGVAQLALRNFNGDLSKLEEVAALELLKHNPGRVQSSYSMYNDFKKTLVSNHLAVQALEKLVLGDKAELMDCDEGSEWTIDLDKLVKIVDVYSEISAKHLVPMKIHLDIVRAISKLDVSPLIYHMKIPADVLNAAVLETDFLKAQDYVYVYESCIDQGQSLSGYAIDKIFMPISGLLLYPPQPSENLTTLKAKVSLQVPELTPLKELVEELRGQIEELELDDNSKTQLNLLRSAAFHSQDITKAIYYFQRYQTRIPDGTLDQLSLKCIMSLGCVIECINSGSGTMLTLAETLVPQTPSPAAENMAALILYHGWVGDDERALHIYNNALDIYLKPKEGQERERGMLIAALVTTCLMQKDVGMAQFIKQKSLENQLINDEYEARITQIMKDYGDLIEEAGQNDGLFEQKMKQIIILQIVNLAP